jgi:nitrogen fixation/metabolism regulation signal transduction histidine kinase
MSGQLTYEELEQHVHELETNKTLQEESILERLIENIQIGIVVHGKDGTVIRSNRVSEVMLSLTHEQMLGKKLIDPAWTFFKREWQPNGG